MKTLEEIALLVQGTKVIGNAGTKISGIEHDSRKVKPGDLFICMEGAHFDGNNFIKQAAKIRICRKEFRRWLQAIC